MTPSSDSKITVIDSHTERVYLTVAEAQAADMDRGRLVSRITGPTRLRGLRGPRRP